MFCFSCDSNHQCVLECVRHREGMSEVDIARLFRPFEDAKQSWIEASWNGVGLGDFEDAY